MKKIYHHFESIDSTNSWTKRNLSHFAKDALIIITCDEQTAGYGQKKRAWLAPKGGGLWVTFCFYKEEADGFLLTRQMAESILRVLEEEGIKGTLKWPNDILVEGKKIAGILTEIADNFVLIGVGLNVNMNEDLLKTIDQPATSMFALTGKQFVVKELCERIVFSLLS